MKKSDENNSGAKIPFREKFCERFDMPPDVFGGTSCVEIKGGCQMIVRGCVKILEYGSETITLQLTDGVLEINGARLYCTAYIAQAVEVSGKFKEIRFRQ